MAPLFNLARMTVASSGTGNITLSNAVQGFLTFDQAGCSTAAAGQLVSYAINDTNNSEIGTGTYISSSLLLSRTPNESTNGGAAIDMSNAAQVFITPRAEDLYPVPVINGGTGTTTQQSSGRVLITGTSGVFETDANLTFQTSAGGGLAIGSTRNSTGATIGALTVTGGLGVALDVYFGGLLNISSGVTANSMSLSSAATMTKLTVSSTATIEAVTVSSNASIGAGLTVSSNVGANAVNASSHVNFGGNANSGGFGSAANPAFTFTSDPDTGIYRSAANTLGIAAGGAAGATFTSIYAELIPGAGAAAGGSSQRGVALGNGGDFGIYFGTGAPTLLVSQGSLYLRNNGTSTNTRMYVAVSSSGSWTPILTGA